jgi:hypothetical protein
MPELLATGDGKRSPTIIGDVFIHRSAKVHPTVKVSLSSIYTLDNTFGPQAFYGYSNEVTGTNIVHVFRDCLAIMQGVDARTLSPAARAEGSVV